MTCWKILPRPSKGYEIAAGLNQTQKYSAAAKLAAEQSALTHTVASLSHGMVTNVAPVLVAGEKVSMLT